MSEFLEMLRGKLSDQMKMLIVAGQKPPFPYESPASRRRSSTRSGTCPTSASCFAMRDLLADAPVLLAASRSSSPPAPRRGQGAAAKPPVEAAIGEATKERQVGLDHAVVRQADDRRDGPRVGSDPDAALAEVAGVLLSGRVPCAVAVGVPGRRRRPSTSAKTTCYVFEFDPNRALALVAEYGIRLAGLGDTTPSEVIGELLNYLPIYAFAGGAMTQLDADGRPRLGNRRHRRNGPGPAVELAAAGRTSTSTPSAALLEHPELLATLDRSRTSAPGQQRRADRHLDKAAEEGQARAGRQARPGAEEETDARPPSSARRSARSSRSSSPRSRSSCTSPTSVRRPSSTSSSRWTPPCSNGSWADGRGLQAPQRARAVQRPAHERCDLPVQVLRDHQPPYANDPHASRPELRPVGLWDRVLQPGEDIDEALAEVEAEQKVEPTPSAPPIATDKTKKKHKRKKK